MEHKELKSEKSFVDYFVEKQKIDTETVQCIRTYGWGDKSVLRVEYADFYKDYKPIALAKKYLREKFGYIPKHLNFNNGHYDRIGCSALNVYDMNKSDFEKYSELPTVLYAKYDEKEDWGYIEFAIHTDQQCALCYAGKLYEYFNKSNN